MMGGGCSQLRIMLISGLCVISRVEPLGSATCYGKSCGNFVALPWVNGDYAAIDNDVLLRETLTLRYFKNKMVWPGSHPSFYSLACRTSYSHY
jgi:hypothetical protein